MSFPNLPPLYKYSFFDPEEHFLGLLAGRLYFCSARDFNDPFDCRLSYDTETAAPERRLEYVLDALGRFNEQQSEAERLREAQEWVQSSINDPEFMRNRQEILVEQQLDKFGICCLSEVVDDILMWSHYAEAHTGLCIGLDAAVLADRAESVVVELGLVSPSPVTYEDEMLPPDFYEMMLSEDDIESELMSTVTTKSSHWAYEREVRLFYWNHVGESFDFGVNVVREVFLGCRISSSNLNRVLVELDRLESSAKVSRAVPHNSRFELTFERIR